jgi:hypothetical protein
VMDGTDDVDFIMIYFNWKTYIVCASVREGCK